MTSRYGRGGAAVTAVSDFEAMSVVDGESQRKYPVRDPFLPGLNREWHEPALYLLGAVVGLHWVEHIAQAIQIWALHYKKSAAHGLIGAQWPWLVTSEWLHYGFALVMLAGLVSLRPGFTGRARTFWTTALAIQVWHFIEHQILLVQAVSHRYWFGAKVPTSVLQHFWPMDRPELHLVYNTLVTIPMIVAVYFHRSPPVHEEDLQACAAATGRPSLRATSSSGR